MSDAIIYLLIFAGWGSLLLIGGYFGDKWEQRNDQ